MLERKGTSSPVLAGEGDWSDPRPRPLNVRRSVRMDDTGWAGGDDLFNSIADRKRKSSSFHRMRTMGQSFKGLQISTANRGHNKSPTPLLRTGT